MLSVPEMLTWPPSGRHALEFRRLRGQVHHGTSQWCLRVLKGLWLGLPLLVGGCTGGPEPRRELRVGSPAPEVMQLEGRAAIVIAGSVDDCLSWDLLGLFVALRALQHSRATAPTPEVIFLAVSNRASDTLYFRQTLRRERVEGRITTVPPRAVSRLFVPDRLPAMYLLDHGVIVAAWEPSLEHRVVTIERDELLGLIESRSRGNQGQ